MKRLLKIEPDNNYFLTCYFEDGTVKKINLAYLLDYPAFTILKDESIFKKAKNKNYFVEWEGYDLDLSSDTLWNA